MHPGEDSDLAHVFFFRIDCSVEIRFAAASQTSSIPISNCNTGSSLRRTAWLMVLLVAFYLYPSDCAAFATTPQMSATAFLTVEKTPRSIQIAR